MAGPKRAKFDRRSALLAAGIAAALYFPASASAVPQTRPHTAVSAAQQAQFAKIDQYFREQTAADKFSGAVLIIDHGRTLFERGYGLAIREKGERVTPDTKFNLGSINKYMTKIAIYQLLEAGKLSLDDKVGKILPTYPNPAVRDKVTVGQLVTMQSGVPDYWNDRFLAHRKELHTTDDFLALFATDPLHFEPGTSREYSTGGYMILGKIVEQLSGMSYGDYVRKHITGPIGMKSTTLVTPPEGQRGTAVGYTRIPGKDPIRDPDPKGPLHSSWGMLPGGGSAGGGGYSTVRDFAKLEAALRNGKMFKRAETTDLFLGPDFRKGSGRPSGWDGGYAGTNTVFIMMPDGTTILIFTNRDIPVAFDAEDKVFEILGKHRDNR